MFSNKRLVMFITTVMCLGLSIACAETSMSALEKVDEFIAEGYAKYGTHYFWPLEAKRAMSQLQVDLGVAETCTNGLPSEGEVSEEEAIAIATEVMIEDLGLTKEEANMLHAGVWFFLADAYTPQNIWQIDFVPDTEDVRQNGTLNIYTVQISAVDGEVLEIYPPIEQPFS